LTAAFETYGLRLPIGQRNLFHRIHILIVAGHRLGCGCDDLGHMLRVQVSDAIVSRRWIEFDHLKSNLKFMGVSGCILDTESSRYSCWWVSITEKRTHDERMIKLTNSKISAPIA